VRLELTANIQNKATLHLHLSLNKWAKFI